MHFKFDLTFRMLQHTFSPHVLFFKLNFDGRRTRVSTILWMKLLEMLFTFFRLEEKNLTNAKRSIIPFTKQNKAMWLLVSLKDLLRTIFLCFLSPWLPDMGWRQVHAKKRKKRSQQIYKFIASKYRTWNEKQQDKTSGLRMRGPQTKTLRPWICPLLKKSSLDYHEFKNFPPISTLPFLSKVSWKSSG